MSNVSAQRLDWAVNLDIGWTGFISRRRDWIASGIDWFCRWEDLSGDPPICHTFIVTGPNSTIEAFTTGVSCGTLSDYLNDPDVALLVRRPINWSGVIASNLVYEGNRHLGERYNFLLIAALGIKGSFLGHGLDTITKGWFSDKITQIADRKNQEICSELVAKVMRSEYGSAGILKEQDCNISPQGLFGDRVIYGDPAIELL